MRNYRMDSNDKKTTIDSELRSLWSEGLEPDRSDRVLDALSSLGDPPIPTALRAKLRHGGASERPAWFPLRFGAALAAGACMIAIALSMRAEAVRPTRQAVASSMVRPTASIAPEDDELQNVFVFEIFDDDLILLEDVL